VVTTLRLAEVAGALSLATDLAMGQQLEHGLRTAMIAVRLARHAGLTEDEQVTVYYTGLLHFAGCTAESEIDARFFGDELVARARMLPAQFGTRLNLMATMMRVVHSGSTPLARAAVMARSAFTGVAEFHKWAASHCDVARLLGARMGLSEQAQVALRHLYERWDGNGMPGELRGTAIPLAVRLAQVAQDADVAWQYGGTAFASQVLAEHAGSGLDPEAVESALSLGPDLYVDLDAPSVWAQAIDMEPGPRPLVTGRRLDTCLSAIADFADLKSMWMVGHSRGVARIAAAAGLEAGLSATQVRQLRHAALVHDIGRVAVPVSVWAKPGPLTRDDWERVRLHAYHSERVLTIAAGLRPLAALAGAHGERGDGSGYHRGSRDGDLPPEAWLLAAADCYCAMREQRPHRPALDAAAAAAALRGEAKAGRLTEEAVAAVLAVVGQDAGADSWPAREANWLAEEADWQAEPAGQEPGLPARPAGLSARECEVLRLIARGMATKQVARQLGISPKTCDHHIQRMYRKIGLSTRAGATLYALEHGLIG
jgi:HD-GYP domain-containing protein (c-di-GMP phosphodiesterase class II)/DNA-binding CsgD family transcriptional regulator